MPRPLNRRFFLPFTGMASIVMADAVMAYIVMAYIVMAYTIMAYIVMAFADAAWELERLRHVIYD